MLLLNAAAKKRISTINLPKERCILTKVTLDALIAYPMIV